MIIGSKYPLLTTFVLPGWQVVVHLGIAPGAKCIILEQTAKNRGYKNRDVCGFCPANNDCIEGGPEWLDSIIGMRALAKHLKRLGLDVIYSRDAGRFVLTNGPFIVGGQLPVLLLFYLVLCQSRYLPN